MMPPESFVPLTAAPPASAPREFRVAILNGHNHDTPADGAASAGVAKSAAGFQTLGASQPAPAATAVAPDKKLAEPRVTVQREGDRVTHLRIQCTCGMIMELACVYDAPKAGAQ